MLKKHSELAKMIKQKQNLDSRINKLNKELYDDVFSKTWSYEGKECYIAFVSLEYDKIHLHDVNYKGSRADFTVKQMTFKEFAGYFDIQ